MRLRGGNFVLHDNKHTNYNVKGAIKDIKNKIKVMELLGLNRTMENKRILILKISIYIRIKHR